MKTYMNWSGGKDSALALFKALKDSNYQIDKLLTSVNTYYDRISMHGVRRSLLLQQAAAITIPLETLELPEITTMKEYEDLTKEKISKLKNEGFEHSLFGDLFLEDLRLYRENQLSENGIGCSFPLWNINTLDLLCELLDIGFKTIIVCVNERYLDKSFCGRIIDYNFIEDLPKNVDPCGENGEFHTFVFDGPIFKNPVKFTKGDISYKTYPAPKNDNDNCFLSVSGIEYGFYFCDLIPVNE